MKGPYLPTSIRGNVPLYVPQCRSALDSRFSGANVSTALAAATEYRDSADNRRTLEAARLPWQAARVCITALAPSLTFVGAVRVVEAALRQAYREHGISSSCSVRSPFDLLVCVDTGV